MPIIYLWRSRNKTIEHAAMQTDTYYLSFWPQQYPTSDDCQIRQQVLGWLAHEGSLVFSLDFDVLIQGDQQPDEMLTVGNVTDDAINEWYRRMLTFNEIANQDVSLEKANEVLNTWEGLSENEKRRVGDAYEYFRLGLSQQLPRTQYSIYGHVMYQKPPKKLLSFNSLRKLCGFQCFYHYPQSSVTLLYNLIESADTYPYLAFRVDHSRYIRSRMCYEYLFTVREFECLVTQHYLQERKMQKKWYHLITERNLFW